jgi:hypothetical protein
MKCNGIHCPGCGDGGGSVAGFIVLLVAVALIWRVVTAGMHKASEVGKAVSADVTAVLHVVLLAAIGLGATAAVGTIGLVVWQLRRTRVTRELTARPRTIQPVALTSIQNVESPRAIEQHLHFHGVSPADVAAILQRQNENA